MLVKCNGLITRGVQIGVEGTKGILLSFKISIIQADSSVVYKGETMPRCFKHTYYQFAINKHVQSRKG